MIPHQPGDPGEPPEDGEYQSKSVHPETLPRCSVIEADSYAATVWHADRFASFFSRNWPRWLGSKKRPLS